MHLYTPIITILNDKNFDIQNNLQLVNQIKLQDDFYAKVDKVLNSKNLSKKS